MTSNNKHLLTYLNFISKDFYLDTYTGSKILSHIKKLDKFIVAIIYLYIYLLSFLSRCFFFKSFSLLENHRISFLVKILFVFNFFIKKVDQVIFTIINLHIYADEELPRVTLKKDKNLDSNSNYSKFIIIGSGPSGAVTASELAKHHSGDILILEKGSFFDIPNSKHPGDEFSKKWYRGGVNSTYFPEMIAYSSGSCFGGGSEVNSGLFHEPDKNFLDEWKREYQTDGLDEESIKEYCDKVNSLTSHKQNIDTKFSNSFIEGAEKGNQKYSELKKFYNQYSGKKNSMSKTLLQDFLKYGGKVELNTEALNIEYKDNQWFVKTKQDGELKYFSCKYLFLCSGSIFTNNLLLKSHISRQKRKTISKFTFHPMIKMIGSYKEDIQALNEDVIAHQNMEFWPKFIIGNASSSIQFLLSSFHNETVIKNFIENNWKKMKIFHATFSLGSGKIINLPFTKEPTLLYFLKRSDKNIINKAAMELFNFIKNTGTDFVIPIIKKNPKLIKTSEKDFNLNNMQSFNNFQLSSVHILGGVTMGEKPECVVDSYGRVKDYEGLYVNDSSLINTKLLKNPQGTIMVIAYRNIDNFLNKA